MSIEHAVCAKVISETQSHLPDVWWYNPLADVNLADSPKSLRNPKRLAVAHIEDFQFCFAQLAQPSDIMLVSQQPPPTWVGHMEKAGFRLPRFVPQQSTPKQLGYASVGDVYPWGWCPQAQRTLDSWVRRSEPHTPWGHTSVALAHDLGPLTRVSSKSFSARWWRNYAQQNPQVCDALHYDDSWLPQVLHEEKRVLNWARERLGKGTPVVLKSPYGTTGRDNFWVRQEADLTVSLKGWVRRTLQRHHALIAELQLRKVADLSAQLDTAEQDAPPQIRRFYVGAHGEFRGTHFADNDQVATWLDQTVGEEARQAWQRILEQLREDIAAEGYRGPVGVDALVFERAKGQYGLYPVVEFNPRFTMGRVGIEVQRHCHRPGAWLCVLASDVQQSLPTWVADAVQRFPVEVDNNQIVSGLLPTNPTSTSSAAVTIAVVGEAALNWVRDQIRCPAWQDAPLPTPDLDGLRKRKGFSRAAG